MVEILKPGNQSAEYLEYCSCDCISAGDFYCEDEILYNEHPEMIQKHAEQKAKGEQPH